MIAKYGFITLLLIICTGCATTDYLFAPPTKETLAYRQFDHALQDQEGEFHATGEMRTLDSYYGVRTVNKKGIQEG